MGFNKKTPLKQASETNFGGVLATLGLLAAAVLTPHQASAQTEPAFRFGEAPLLAPNSAAVSNYYGSSTTHTNGHGAGRHDELVSVAAGLDHDPALIFEFVHDNIEYYPTFGLGKGALGAYLDKSGNAFDQAHLLAELLDEAKDNGASISGIVIKYGTLSLSSTAEIKDWLGFADANEVCRLLANGGIPGRVNGGTNCSAGGTATSLEIAHVWVEATVNGSPTFYDPSYKIYEDIAPLVVGGNDYRDAMGANCTNAHALSAGAAASQGTTTGGSEWLKSFNYGGLASHLQSCATSLWNWIENNAAGASVEELLGGRKIDPDGATLSQSHYNESLSWSEIPDQYRFKVTVDVDRPDNPGGGAPNIDLSFDLYMDEVYGRRVALEPNGFGDVDNYPSLTSVGLEASCNDNDFLYALQLTIDDNPIPGVGIKGPCAPHIRGSFTYVSVDAPYAADGGSYLDRVEFTSNQTFVTRAVLAFAAGESTAGWAREYQRNLGVDRTSVEFWNGYACCGTEPELPASVSTQALVAENVRYRIFAAWAEQFSRLLELSEGIAETKLQHHYTVGWSSGVTRVEALCESTACSYTLGDDVAVMNLDTAVSTPKASAAPVKRIVAGAAAALEASVMEQQLDSTAPGGVAQKFRWGNDDSLRALPSGVVMAAPYGSEPTGDFPVYHFAPGDDLEVLTADGHDDCSNQASIYVQVCYEGALQYSIKNYLDAGYHVIAMGDAYLGPGLRCGRYFFSAGSSAPKFKQINSYTVFVTEDQETGETTVNIVSSGGFSYGSGGGQWNCESNLSRGGAFIAYDPNDYSKIAHISFNGDRMNKGGAAGASMPMELATINVPTPADLLKEEEEDSFLHNVDLRSGKLNLSTGSLLTAGTGEFPYSLPFSRSFQSGQSGKTDPIWDHNWNMPLTISGSGNEMMGSSRAIFASESIAYLSVLMGVFNDSGTSGHARVKQETVGVLAAAWWTDRLSHNVVNAKASGQTAQFVRKLGLNEFYPTSGGAAYVTQSGSRYQHYPYSVSLSGGAKQITALAWRTDNLSFTLHNPGGDYIKYNHWRPYYLNPWESAVVPFGSASNADKPGWRAEKWTFPGATNFTIDFEYLSSTRAQCESSPLSNCVKPKLDFVINSIGRKLKFTGPMDNPTAVAEEVDSNTVQSISLTDTSVTHTDGKVTNYAISLVDQSFQFGDVIYEKYLDSITEPGHAGANHEFAYDGVGHVRTYTNAHDNSWTYLIGGGGRGATRDPYGAEAVEYYDRDGNNIRSVDKVGEATKKEYDGAGRLIRREMPEGDWLEVDYDKHSNVVEVRQYGKGGEGPLTTSAVYGDANWPTKPTSVTDPNGNTTTITYRGVSANGAGKVFKVTQPPDMDSVTPIWTYAYDAQGRLFKVTNPENEITEASYGALGVFEGITLDPSGLNLSTTITAHNDLGDPTTVNGPRTDVSDVFNFTYDSARRPLTTTDPMGSVTETIYDEDYGWPVKQCVQIASSPSVTCANAAPAGNQWAVTETTYSATGQPLTVTDPDGAITATYYDALDRPVVSIDAAGRKTRTVYDAAGRAVKLIRAWSGANDGAGATLDCDVMRADAAADPINALQQCYQHYSYTPNGQIDWVEDANANRTTYEYDEYDRLEFTRFPSKTQIKTSASTNDLDPDNDYEKLTYDNNGNVLFKRTRAAQTIRYEYDNLNRLDRRQVPGVNGWYDFEYDLAGRQTFAKVTGYRQENVYDDAGRLTARIYSHDSTTAGKEGVIGYQLDEAGNVLRLTHTDGFWVQYAYDALNRVTRACENLSATSCASAGSPLALVSYDRLSRRTSLALGNGTSAKYGYTARGDLTCLDWNLTGTAPSACNAGAPEIAYDFAYNGSGQMTSKTVSDAALGFTPPGTGPDAYVVNGLNQYASVTPSGGSSASFTYNDNGNMSADHRGWTYFYDAENRLKTIKTDTSATALTSGSWPDGTYSFFGRYIEGLNSRHIYDGDQEIFETLGGVQFADNKPWRRYIRLPGSVDEPLLMITYSYSGNENGRHWAHADYMGSVVATTDGSGAIIDRYRYSAYGVPGSEGDTGFPFRFTGQRLWAGTGLYHYKARWYHPEIGRFLQTDPIGYEDQMNLYAYVGNDPVNVVDPSGEQALAFANHRLTEAKLNAGVPRSTINRQASVDLAIATVALAAVVGPEIYLACRTGACNGPAIFAAEVAAGDSLGPLGAAGLGAISLRSLTALQNVGFERIAIDGKTFINKAFSVGNRTYEVGGTVTTKGSHIFIADAQIFPIDGGPGPGAAAINNIRNQLSNDLAEAGFETATISGTRLTGATEGQEKSVTFATCLASGAEGC